MHHHVVVQQHHVPSLHLHRHGQLHGDLVQVLQLLHRHLLAVVGVVHVGLVDPRGPGGLREALVAEDLLALTAQVLRMGVHGPPPGRLAREGVPDDGHLRRGPDLEDLAPVVLRALPEELRVEVHLHPQSLLQDPVGHGLRCALQRPEILQETHGELRSGVLDLTAVDFLQPVLIEPPEHLPPVGDEELAPLFGGLEADEDGRAGGAVPHHLVVHADVELPPRGLVHRLVDPGLLVHGIACGN
mmetsp:Transcript_94382/g.281684  ORF Transcript_94382/g.281684 Transcript_94382/m.281684 type:complete len:243 (-) Transcript_94382:367-1095(-)